MRIVPVAIAMICVILFSTILSSMSSTNLKVRKAITVVLYVVASFFSVSLIVLFFDSDIVPHRLLLWFMWAMFTIYTSLFIFSVSYAVGRIIEYFAKRRVRVFQYVGGVLAVIVSGVMIVGMLSRHDVEVRELTIAYDNLPEEFNDTKIVHITDLHLGSLYPEKKYLQEIERMITSLKPDMLMFTGDLLNLSAEDGAVHVNLFRDIPTPLGKYSVLGNHDYGSYAGFKSSAELENNMLETKDLISGMGFTLLCDSSVMVVKGRDSVCIVGVEHCGNKLFPCYSDLASVQEEFCAGGFNILLAHDPDYWLNHVPSDLPFADLTLSGHTHSAQFGIECGGVKLSPSSFIFENWDGLYSNDDEKRRHDLYVSRGLGYTGMPFRFGMRAEITVINLVSK